MSNEGVIILKKKQLIFADLTNLCQFFASAKFLSNEAKAKYHRLEVIESKIDEIYFEIFVYNESVIDLSEQILETDRDKFIDLVDTIRAKYTNLLCQVTSTSLGAQVASVAEPCDRSGASLPRLHLPVFDGSLDKWQNFISLFNSLVHNNSSLSVERKFHYLKANLKGEPLSCISNFAIDQANYQSAYEALISRYQNPRRLASFYLQQILKFKISSPVNWQYFLDVHNTSINALKNLGVADLADFLFFQLTYNNLDMNTQKMFDLRLTSTDVPNFNQLHEFVELLAKTDELKRDTLFNSSNFEKSNKKSKSIATLTTSIKSKFLCSLCNEQHFLACCPKYRAKSLDEKVNFVKLHKLCINCLGNHFVRDCFSQKTCNVCSKKHHTSIHRKFIGPLVEKGSKEQINLESFTQSESKLDNKSISSHVSFSKKAAILATAIVHVKSSSGQYFPIRALIDQGSEVSFISQSLVQSLKLSPRKKSVYISGIAGVENAISKASVALEFKSTTQNHASYLVSTLILPKLTSYLPKSNFDWSQLKKFAHLELADPYPLNQNPPIELVLGVDIYSQILQEGIYRPQNASIIAQNTTLGWIISGISKSDSENSKVSSLQCTVDDQLTDLVQKFWETENCNEHPIVSQIDKECENHFKATYTRLESGKYMLRLPFKSNPKVLGTSFMCAKSSLMRLENKFKDAPTFKKEYSYFLNEYEDLNHMERVTNPKDDAGYYFPHHGVYKDSKIRVVFNGSQKTSSGLSLNDILHVGPQLLPQLTDVIIRWRRHRIVFTTDIEKMYRQIWVHPDDRKFQKILWQRDNCVNTYELKTITYGTSCAPFLAMRTLLQLADDEEQNFPKASDILRNDAYVDDILSGGDSEEDAYEMQKQLIKLLTAGGFPARKWTSNSVKLLDHLPTELKAVSRNLSEKSVEIFSTLGLIWNSTTDSFSYSLRTKFEKLSVVSKRIVLSKLAQLFDPLGFLSPFFVQFKIFFQSLWLLGLNWDDSLPERDILRWQELYSQLINIEKFTIPRWLKCSLNTDQIFEFHVFADASEKAYAAVIYHRIVNPTDDLISVNLLMARTKVAPLKQISLPRLELSAALLACKLARYMVDVLSVPKFSIFAWTDSKIVLHWIKSSPTRWKTFIANRVSSIQTTLPEAHWLHVPSAYNPADCASRGLSSDTLINFKQWWKGPSWLSLPSNFWPQQVQMDINEELELKSVFSAHPATVSDESNDFLCRFSKLSNLLRVTSWCIRFFNRCKGKALNKSSTITFQELLLALETWIRVVQGLQFSSEIKLLQNGKVISKSSSILRLNPFCDEKGILRVGGRLANSVLTYNQKHPILIPKGFKFTELIISNAHHQTFHGGIQSTLAYIRMKFWIIHGRQEVKRYINNCVRCRRFQTSPPSQQMGNFPPERVTPSRPFLKTGVDYAGPFMVTPLRGRGYRAHKTYLALFVCLATRAVHLELVTDYTADAFLAAYRRFISRRGHCETIISDNGSNFIKAAKELRNLFNQATLEGQKIANTLAENCTSWKFIPPGAPHMGGIWEAAIKSTKTHLKRIIGETVLSYEEMTTLLSQIEAILNSRPLEALHDDVTNMEVLTPGHFLIGGPLIAIPEPSLEVTKLSSLSRWQLVQRMTQSFWKKWNSDYLQSLQVRRKWLYPKYEISVGDLVLIRHENYPATKWPLGRIIQIYPGKDGLVRIASIKTQNSTLTRPIIKLVPLLKSN